MISPVSIVCAAALLLAVGPWPYGYYMLLRVVVFAGGIFCGALLLEKNKALAIALFIFAVLFNPIAPVHLTRPIWAVLNIAGAALFAFIAYREHRRT